MYHCLCTYFPYIILPQPLSTLFPYTTLFRSTFIHVAKNVYDQVEGKEKEVFDMPEFMVKMNEKGMLGAKSGKGFYLRKKRSEEHTSELQSRGHLVCRLLLEKKKKKQDKY